MYHARAVGPDEFNRGFNMKSPRTLFGIAIVVGAEQADLENRTARIIARRHQTVPRIAAQQQSERITTHPNPFIFEREFQIPHI